MENYKDIESLLTPRVEAKASDKLRTKIADIEPQKKHNHWWTAIAASIAAVFCLGVAAATIYHLAPKATEEAPTTGTNVVLPADTIAKPDFFVFDNVEMEKVAATLGKHFNLKPVFENDAVKHKRIYVKVNKKKTIEEVVELLNNFDEINVSVSDGKLIIK